LRNESASEEEPEEYKQDMAVMGQLEFESEEQALGQQSHQAQQAPAPMSQQAFGNQHQLFEEPNQPFYESMLSTLD